MDCVLAQYPGVPSFLFAHQGVVDFYPKFGFRYVAEAQPHLTLDHPVSGAGSCLRLSPENPRLVGLLGRRHCFSDILDARNAASKAIVGALPFAGVDTIEFAFTPDWLCSEYSIRPYDSVMKDSYLYVRGLDWPRGAKFPHTAVT
jgi:hypothetical protein